MKYIIAIGIFQALLTAILLLRSRHRSSADDLVISLVVCISIHLSIKFFIFNYVSDTDVVALLNTFIWFSYFPLLYLYTLKAIQKDFIPATKWYVFIPFFICAIGYFSVISLFLVESPESDNVLYWYNEISLWLIIPSELISPYLIAQMALKKLPKSSEERKLIVQISSLFFIGGIISVIFIVLKPYLLSDGYFSRSPVYGVLIVISVRIIAHRYLAVNSTFKQSIDEVVNFSSSNYNPVPAFSGVPNEIGEITAQVTPITEIKNNQIFLVHDKKHNSLISSKLEVE